MFALRIVALCALLSAATAHALDDVQWNTRISGLLDKRQQEEQKPGSNCTEAFGAGYETCRPASDTEIRLCYNPTIGQICCQNEWGCPSGSFCLVKNVCCPTGVDPSTCASHYSVSLPPTLSTSGSGPASTTPGDSTTIVSTIITSTPVSTISLPSSTGTTSTASIIPVPYPAGNVSATHGFIASSAQGSGFLASATGKILATGTVSGTGSAVTSPTLFEGSGARNFEGNSWLSGALGVVVAIVGFA